MNSKGCYCPHCRVWVPAFHTHCTNLGCGKPLFAPAKPKGWGIMPVLEWKM
jgi:hypothetical protein